MADSDTAPVLYDVEDNVATLTLNRPDRRNAISTAMLAQLTERLEQAEADREVRAIIITGAAPGGFCAGLDLVDATSGKGIGSDGGEAARRYKPVTCPRSCCSRSTSP